MGGEGGQSRPESKATLGYNAPANSQPAIGCDAWRHTDRRQVTRQEMIFPYVLRNQPRVNCVTSSEQ
jgi:hypothetical protein